MPSSSSSARQERRWKKFQQNPSLIKTATLPCITPREISLLEAEDWEERITLSLQQYLALPEEHRLSLPISPLLAGQIKQQRALFKESETTDANKQENLPKEPLLAEILSFSPISSISIKPSFPPRAIIKTQQKGVPFKASGATDSNQQRNSRKDPLLAEIFTFSPIICESTKPSVSPRAIVQTQQ